MAPDGGGEVAGTEKENINCYRRKDLKEHHQERPVYVLS